MGGVGKAASLNKPPLGRGLEALFRPSRDEKFIRDVMELVARLSQDLPHGLATELEALGEKLLWLREEGRVKINHSAMELVCAKELLALGYKVDVEHEVNGLVCDVYAWAGGEDLVVEVETGFVPPDHALDPLTYLRARIASKIARYSCLADCFALGLPPHYVALIPDALLRSGEERGEGEILELKQLCDYYYHNPPVSLEELRSAKLDWVFIIDVDGLSTTMISPGCYQEAVKAFLRASLPSSTLLQEIGI